MVVKVNNIRPPDLGTKKLVGLFFFFPREVRRKSCRGSAFFFADSATEAVSSVPRIFRASLEAVNADVTTSISTLKMLSSSEIVR
jgi:hypothetical protein